MFRFLRGKWGNLEVQKAIELWRKEGAPAIHLPPRGLCLNLEELLSNTDTPFNDIETVRAWLEKHGHVKS